MRIRFANALSRQPKRAIGHGLLDPAHLDELVARALAADDRDLTWRDAELVGQDAGHRSVSPALERRCRHAHDDHAVADEGDLVAACPRLHADGDPRARHAPMIAMISLHGTGPIW